jgi:hypothetical protein
MRLRRPAGRARLLLGTAVAVVGMLGGSVWAAPAQAAPRDNLANARLCLGGGWTTLQTAGNRPFRNVGWCVLYALVGGRFASPPPPSEVPPPPSGDSGDSEDPTE